MHSNAQLMLSKNAATVPFGMGGFPIYRQDNNYLIHSFINLIHSL